MLEKINIEPLPNELPSDFADRCGQQYSEKVTQEYKKVNGQFFTPLPIARLMAGYAERTEKKINILDPGVGAGVLICAITEQLVVNTCIEELCIACYETDKNLINVVTNVFTYLQNWVQANGKKFIFNIFNDDFILSNSLTLNGSCGEKFDLIITNPPFFKIPKEDIRTKAASEFVSGHANIYALFIGISLTLLKNKGRIIFISPRSFASGNYFKAFRSKLFSLVQVKNIHLFDSRTDTFDRDKVLQELVIISATKEKINPEKKVNISSSDGLHDIKTPFVNSLPLHDIIEIHSKEKILHLPVNKTEINILEITEGWNNKLTDFNIHISTGPVVSFRANGYIKSNINDADNCVPLYWLHNVTKMKIEWPKVYKEKGQYIVENEYSRNLLIKNKNYIFLRRFSTKDDKSRLIAAPYYYENNFNFIGVENKLNYIYKINENFEKNEMLGLCALLNSEFYDIYFQTFNGNVNVSATELREMKFPPMEIIKKIGIEIMLNYDLSLASLNSIVNQYLELENILV